jgi:hypothetical protein
VCYTDICKEYHRINIHDLSHLHRHREHRNLSAWALGDASNRACFNGPSATISAEDVIGYLPSG